MINLTSIIDSVKEISVDAISPSLPKSFTLPLSEALLNGLLEKLVSETAGPIQSLALSFYDGGFKAKALVVKKGVTSSAESDFVIEKFEISSANKVVVLRRSSELSIDGDNWWSKVAVFVLQAIVTGLLRDSMIGRFIGSTDGVTVNDPEVSVDFGRLGISEKIVDTVTEKWLDDNPLLKIGLTLLAKKAGKTLTNFVSITGAQCTASGVQINVKLRE